MTASPSWVVVPPVGPRSPATTLLTTKNNEVAKQLANKNPYAKETINSGGTLAVGAQQPLRGSGKNKKYIMEPAVKVCPPAASRSSCVVEGPAVVADFPARATTTGESRDDDNNCRRQLHHAIVRMDDTSPPTTTTLPWAGTLPTCCSSSSDDESWLRNMFPSGSTEQRCGDDDGGVKSRVPPTHPVGGRDRVRRLAPTPMFLKMQQRYQREQEAYREQFLARQDMQQHILHPMFASTTGVWKEEQQQQQQQHGKCQQHHHPAATRTSSSRLASSPSSSSWNVTREQQEQKPKVVDQALLSRRDRERPDWIPSVVVFCAQWVTEEDDAVSALYEDPDVDDEECLPPSTITVLEDFFDGDVFEEETESLDDDGVEGEDDDDDEESDNSSCFSSSNSSGTDTDSDGSDTDTNGTSTEEGGSSSSDTGTNGSENSTEASTCTGGSGTCSSTDTDTSCTASSSGSEEDSETNTDSYSTTSREKEESYSFVATDYADFLI